MGKWLASRRRIAYPYSMAARKRIKTKYPGVYYRESARRRHKGRPDRCYMFWYNGADGKGHWETVGWASERVTADYTRARRNEFLAKLNRGESVPSPTAMRFTVGQAVASYEAWARAKGKHIDVEMNRWANHMKATFAALPISSITVAMLASHQLKLMDKLSEQSVKHCFSFLRRCINHAIDMEEYAGQNPVRSRRNSKFNLPDPDNECVRYLTPQEAKALLDELRPRSPQTHDMSITSLRTGLRLTEVWTIRGRDLDDRANVIHFTAKGGKRDSVPAPREVLDLLKSYNRAPDEHVFQARDGGPLSDGISSAWDRAVNRLKLNDGYDRPCDKTTFHIWRHTFASWLAQSGEVTLQELKELMRHSRIEMTLRYAHLFPGHKRKSQGIIADVLATAFDEAEDE